MGNINQLVYMKEIARNAMRAYRGVMVVATGSTLRVLKTVSVIFLTVLITGFYYVHLYERCR